MTVIQPYQRTVANNLNYMVARGRIPTPYIPEMPVFTKQSQLTRLRASVNGVVLPGGPEPSDRDLTLKPWYGDLGGVGSPYAVTGPTKDQVGLTVPYSELTDYNSPTTENFPVTTLLTLDKKKVHGRIKLSGSGRIIATNCEFDGPVTPSNTSLFTGETAIIDGNNAAAAISTFTDCVIHSKVPHPRFNAHKGSRARFERCHVFHVVDGFGPYSTPGQTFPTAFELVASRVEKLIYYPGPYFANRNPAYWNGTTYQSSSSGAYTRTANGTALDRAGYIDDIHADGNHSDCIEVHNAFGSHTFNPTTERWTGDGIHIWGNALICDDAYGQGNPSNITIGSPNLGYGDNPKRGLLSGGQLPGMARPQTSWNKPVTPARYSANGVGLYIGQVTNVQFEGPTSVVAHSNYISYGNMGMQEQKKSLSYIAFVLYDNIFGGTQSDPTFYRWSSDNTRDVYAVRLNDYTTANTMPNFTSGPVRIPNHPVTNAPPFGPGASNRWTDGSPLLIGSSSLSGVRVI